MFATQQAMIPLQASIPTTTNTAKAMQDQITSLMSSILPLFTLMLVFSMILPMFRQMGSPVKA